MAYKWGNGQPPSHRHRIIGAINLWLGGLLMASSFGMMLGATKLVFPDSVGLFGLVGVIGSCLFIIAGVTYRYGGG